MVQECFHPAGFNRRSIHGGDVELALSVSLGFCDSFGLVRTEQPAVRAANRYRMHTSRHMLLFNFMINISFI